MRIKPFQGIFPNYDFITSPGSFFRTVKFEYPEYAKSGFFQKASREAMYILRIEKGDRNYTGVIACADVRDFMNGNIKKHELTLAAKEQQQLQLLLRREAALKPVLLAYPDVESINKWVADFIEDKEPIYTVPFEEEAIVHKIWEVSEGKDIGKLKGLFEKEVPFTYIGDGHHRCLAAALLHDRMKGKQRSEDFTLLFSGFFPASELDILEFNRIVDGLRDVSPLSFMAKLSQLFDIEIMDGPAKPQNKHEITMYINREWFNLRWKSSVLNIFSKMSIVLDSGLLNEQVLKDIIGITDVRNDFRIQYIQGPLGIDEVVKVTSKDPERIAFCLYPVHFEELVALCNAGKALPPKSTFFEPRLRSGVIVQGY